MEARRDRIAIIGASRGLGQALAEHALSQPISNRPTKLLLSSRKIMEQEAKWQALSEDCDLEFFSGDLSQVGAGVRLAQEIFAQGIGRVFYVAGGGPYGVFGSQKWRSHAWALQVNLLSPAELLHELLACGFFASGEEGRLPRQVVVVGSAIADDQPDPQAASYSAAKHGLRGLIQTLQVESPEADIRLFRPGYMATDLLPKDSWPRQKGLAEDPHIVARRLWDWAHQAVPLSS